MALTQPNSDFAEDNVIGARYTSFEPNLQQRNFLDSMAAAKHSSILNSNVGARNIEISLAKSRGAKGRAGNSNKSKEDAEVDLTFKAINIPAEISTYNLTLDPTKLVCFYGREHFLSNYFTAPMTVNGVAYRTIEHYYEACKLFSFGGYQWSSQLNMIKDAGAVKVTSKRLSQFVDKRKLEAWKRSEGLEVIENALTHKFSQHSDLAAKLLATDDAFLAQCNPYDSLWATGLNEEKVKQWATLNQGVTIQIPRVVNAKTLQYCPTSNVGQNALGYLLMQVRASLQSKLRKLEQSGFSADDEISISAAAVPMAPIAPPLGAKAASSSAATTSGTSATESKVCTVAALAKDASPSAVGDSSIENVRKICEQLAHMNVQKAAATSVVALPPAP